MLKNEEQRTNAPLVSIGVPTVNRPELLENALQHLLAQSYRNFEVVISDNASTDMRVTQVIQHFADRDSRIRVFRHELAVSAFENFIFVLKESKGEFFMWAADDDYIEPWFIERCFKQFEVSPHCTLVATEAQYFWQETKFDFIAEGEGFRRPTDGDQLRRMENLIRHNYGNLIYGLFRRSALVDEEGPLWERTLLSSPNEVALLLLAANSGEIVTLPDVGLFKQAPRPVYDQVVWEINGGRHPTGATLSPRSVIGTFKYHWSALQDIYSAIALTGLSSRDKQTLRKSAQSRIAVHFLQLVLGRKSARRGA